MVVSITKGTFYLTISSIIFMFSGYLINIFLGRYLGPAAYGLYGIIFSLVTVINLTQVSGLPQAVTKYISAHTNKTESIYKTGFFLQIISTGIVSVLFFFFSGTIAQLLKDPTLTPYLKLAAGIFPLYGLLALLTGYYNGLHQFGKQAFIHITYSVVKIVGIITLTYFFHLYGVILGFIISLIVTLLLRLHLPKKTDETFPYKKIISFSFPLIGVAICANLLQSIDLFFIKALMHSDSNTGFYTANQNIAEIPYFALTALATVLFPSISKHVSNNRHDEAKNLIQKALRFCLLVLTPAVLIISATSMQALSFLFSSEYHPGAQSLSILVIGSGFFTIFIILTTIISSAGSPIKSAILAGIGVLITSLLCIFLIPILGLNGAALATTIAAGFMMLAAATSVYKKFGVLFNLKSTGKILVASLLLFFLAKMIILPVILLPFVYLFLFAIYVAILSLLKEITKEDIALVRSLVPKKILDKIKL